MDENFTPGSPKGPRASDKSGMTYATHYHEFLHPNLHKKADAISQLDNKPRPKLVQKLEYIDDKYIRPFLVYKYHKIKKRFEFDFEDILQEYQNIEQELNQDSDTEDDDAQSQMPSQYKALSENIANDTTSQNGQYGLLSQYILTKMATQVMGEMYTSQRLSNVNYFDRLSQQSGKFGKDGTSPAFGPNALSHRVSDPRHSSMQRTSGGKSFDQPRQSKRTSEDAQFDIIIEDADKEMQESAVQDSQKSKERLQEK